MRFLLAFFASAALAQTCLVCGEIRGVREISAARSPERINEPVGTRSGLDTPPVVGTVAQFHFGAEKGERWTFGAAGTPDLHTSLGGTTYEVTVVMDSGEKHTLQRRDGNRFRVGQRVALRQGELDPM